ncbi:MAG: DsbA family protein [Hyphomicrobiaceae bacterium]
MTKHVDVYFSLQSDYCYFLVDRLLWLERQGVGVGVRPVLGGVLRIPERYEHRNQLEQDYFECDTARTAAFLGLPYAYPNPSPIAFKPGSLWIAAEEQPRIEHLYRLFVGSVRAGFGTAFLDHVVRMLWDGSTPRWDTGTHLAKAMQRAGLEMDDILASNTWQSVLEELEHNAQSMLSAGHWGVPLLVVGDEPFYGQDRFDQVVWRLGLHDAWKLHC